MMLFGARDDGASHPPTEAASTSPGWQYLASHFALCCSCANSASTDRPTDLGCWHCTLQCSLANLAARRCRLHFSAAIKTDTAFLFHFLGAAAASVHFYP